MVAIPYRFDPGYRHQQGPAPAPIHASLMRGVFLFCLASASPTSTYSVRFLGRRIYIYNCIKLFEGVQGKLFLEKVSLAVFTTLPRPSRTPDPQHGLSSGTSYRAPSAPPAHPLSGKNRKCQSSRVSSPRAPTSESLSRQNQRET